MEGQGKRTNIKDNLPPYMNVEKKKKDAVRQAYDKAEAAVDLMQKIKSPDGQFFVELVEKQLLKRINELMRKDEICESFMRIIRDFNYTVDPAQRVVDSLLERYKSK